MADYGQTDAMIARLEGELEERNAFIQGVIGGAQGADRDLTENEKELIASARDRVQALKGQLDTLQESRETVLAARARSMQIHRDMVAGRREIDKGAVEYRSAGHFVIDAYKAGIGDREARERLELFNREGPAHMKTTDLTGVVPDPVIGGVLNFIDAARPIVGLLGPRNLPSASWHRPKVTQHTAVARQGTAGAAADEKSELVSQALKITRLDASAVTYGGYVNVSRQSLDLGEGVMDAVINDLAANYSIETEAATADALMSVVTGAASIGDGTAAGIVSGLWDAAGAVYQATRGQGRLVLAVSPSVLGMFGPLFAPVNPSNAQSSGFTAAGFGQGVLGSISGISLVMSAGLTGTEAVLFSTAAIEVYEQRVGALSVVEPSVLGVQVGYAGYFTPLVVEAGGIVPLDIESS